VNTRYRISLTSANVGKQLCHVCELKIITKLLVTIIIVFFAFAILEKKSFDI